MHTDEPDQQPQASSLSPTDSPTKTVKVVIQKPATEPVSENIESSSESEGIGHPEPETTEKIYPLKGITDHENIFSFEPFAIDGNISYQSIIIKRTNHILAKYVPEGTIPERCLRPQVIPFGDKRVKLTTDIDAILGPMSFENLPLAFKYNLNISISTRKLSTKTEYALKTALPINMRNIYHMQLGTMDIHGGVLTVFYMCPGHHNSVNSEVLTTYLKTIVTTSKLSRSSSKGGKLIHYENLPAFVDILINTASTTRFHSEDFLFVETFGNKDSLHNAGIETDILTELKRSVDFINFPHLKIDIAVNIEIDGHAVFPCQEFFGYSNLVRNYFLFFNRHMANSHASSGLIRNNVLELESSVVDKHNFYNTIEDLLGYARKSNHTPSITSAAMKSNIVGHSPIRSKNCLEKEYAELLKMINEFLATERRSWPYRMEYRTNPAYIEGIFIDLRAVLEKCTFYAYESEEFLKIIYATSNNLLTCLDSSITNLTIRSIYSSVFFEHLLTKCYLKGAMNLHSITNTLYSYPKKKYTCFKEFFEVTFEDADRYIDKINMAEMYISIDRVVTYDHGLDKNERQLLTGILHIPENNCLEAATIVINRYYIDMCANYKRTPIDNSFQLLRSTGYMPEELERMPVEDIDQAIMRLFGASTNESWLKIPYRCMIAFYRQERSISSQVWLDNIKRAIMDMQITILFRLSPANRIRGNPCLKLKNTTGRKLVMQEITNQTHDIRAGLAANAIRKIGRRESDRLVVWTLEEKIRLLGVRRIFFRLKGNYKGVWTYISNTSIFGFYLLRSQSVMKNLIPRLTKNGELARCESAAEEWNLEEYNFSNILAEMGRFGYNITPEAEEALFELYNYDLNEFKRFNGRNDTENQLGLASNEENVQESASRVARPNNIVDMNRFEDLINTSKNEIISSIKEYIDQKLQVPRLDFNNSSRYQYDLDRHFNDSFSMEERNENNVRVVIPPNVQGDVPVTTEDNMQIENVERNDLVRDEERVSPANDQIYFNLITRYYTSNDMFTASSSRALLFSSAGRPSKQLWQDVIDRLVSTGLLCIVSNTNAKIIKYMIAG